MTEHRPVCLVTGGARRIGAAIAEQLAARFDLALHYRSSRAAADIVRQTLQDRGADVELIAADLADPAQAESLVRAAHARFGRLDLVINNASAFEYDTPSTFDPVRMQRLLNVNLVAPMMIAKSFAELAGEGAVLVNMLDNKVFAPNPDFFSYSLGKVALQGAIEMLALHFRHRLRVCGIAPSVTLISGDQSEENFAKSWRHNLTGRGPTPQDIARTVEFIWDTPSVNAETIVLDSGQRLMSLERDVAFVVE